MSIYIDSIDLCIYSCNYSGNFCMENAICIGSRKQKTLGDSYYYMDSISFVADIVNFHIVSVSIE